MHAGILMQMIACMAGYAGHALALVEVLPIEVSGLRQLVEIGDFRALTAVAGKTDRWRVDTGLLCEIVTVVAARTVGVRHRPPISQLACV